MGRGFRAILRALIIMFQASLALYAGHAHAQMASGAEALTAADFAQLLRQFSTKSCDIDKYMEESTRLGLNPTWSDWDQSDKLPLSQLSRDDLCLISLSSSADFYRYIKQKDGQVIPIKVGGGQKFPSGVRVEKIDFSLPRALVPKHCLTYEGPSAPFSINVTKENSRLVHHILRLDTDQACFSKALRKKGLLPR